MTKIMKQYPGVDLVKFLMAIVVISIHTLPSDYFSASAGEYLYDFLCASAVPFFFVASGFLLAQKAALRAASGKDGMTEEIVRALKKFVKLYVLWMLIYAPMAVWDMYRSGRGIVWCVCYYLRGFFLLGEHYNSWPLWYLLSTIYGLCFLYLLCRKKASMNQILICSVVLFLCGSFATYMFDHADTLSGPLSRIVGILSSVIVPGRIVNGFLYMSMGILAFNCRFSNRMGLVFLLLHLTTLLPVPEVITIPMRAFSGLGIFVFASNLNLKNAAVFPVLRKLSVVMYFLHMYVWTGYYVVVYHEKTFGLDSFLVTTLLCVLMGLIRIFAKETGTRRY